MNIGLLIRRIITLIPAPIILAIGVEPTWALVIAQVLLSFGVPFAIIPLMRYTRDRTIMGVRADASITRWCSPSSPCSSSASISSSSG